MVFLLGDGHSSERGKDADVFERASGARLIISVVVELVDSVSAATESCSALTLDETQLSAAVTLSTVEGVAGVEGNGLASKKIGPRDESSLFRLRINGLVVDDDDPGVVKGESESSNMNLDSSDPASKIVVS